MMMRARKRERERARDCAESEERRREFLSEKVEEEKRSEKRERFSSSAGPDFGLSTFLSGAEVLARRHRWPHEKYL